MLCRYLTYQYNIHVIVINDNSDAVVPKGKH
jgi:hypothetical protein